MHRTPPWLAVSTCIVVSQAVAVAQADTATFAISEQWLAAEQPSRKLLDDAVKELLAEPKSGFDWLARNRDAAGDAQARRKGLESLITHAALEFLRRQRQSGITFAGQYEPLTRLQPTVGELLLGLLLETPSWYPHTHRVRLVRPLRDLFPRAPSEARLAQVAAATASSIEPEELRRALACMLWQWGDKQPAQQRLDTLRSASTEGDPEDRVRTLLELADLQYELLDYRAAAATHRAVHALAAASAVPLKPGDHYASACAHALVGDVERGIEALQRCAAQQASPDVDVSNKLAKTLWENDPEIAILRRDARFAAIFAQAFGPGTAPAEARRR